MFQLLPVVETLLLPFLPMEMWSAILRMLDPKSLLAGVRSYKLWMTVCHGDPILKQTLRFAIEEEVRFARNFMMDPRMSVRVSRMTPATKFAANINKIITTIPKPAAVMMITPDIHSSKQKKTKKSTKCKSNNRYCPYRL